MDDGHKVRSCERESEITIRTQGEMLCVFFVCSHCAVLLLRFFSRSCGCDRGRSREGAPSRAGSTAQSMQSPPFTKLPKSAASCSAFGELLNCFVQLVGVCIASGATCLSPLTAVIMSIWLYTAGRGDENTGRCRFSANLVSARYHFPHESVYGFFDAETVV